MLACLRIGCSCDLSLAGHRIAHQPSQSLGSEAEAVHAGAPPSVRVSQGKSPLRDTTDGEQSECRLHRPALLLVFTGQTGQAGRLVMHASQA